LHPGFAGKITGMLLEINNAELYELIGSDEKLKERANDAYLLLQMEETGRNIPKCKGHQEQCAARVSTKENANKGRTFYKCAKPQEQQCEFFEWAAIPLGIGKPTPKNPPLSPTATSPLNRPAYDFANTKVTAVAKKPPPTFSGAGATPSPAARTSEKVHPMTYGRAPKNSLRHF